MKSPVAQKLTLVFFAALTIWYSFYLIQPPAPQPSSSAPTSFSAERAFKHVEHIAIRPHPLGSDANDRVRNYILTELHALGLRPTLQEGVGVSKSFGQGLAGYSKNIFAKIEGADPEKTILLMAHYDSAPNALGAADDASGVAAILETIRAIQSRDHNLKNNVWILFTDGEERGLLGAELFADQFPNLEKIDLVLNFEARGSSGPSMMFETSTPNGGLIPPFAKATSDPVANSLMYTVYKMLPNDTDMTVTKRAGLQGINFAFANQLLNYHTIQDSPQNLSLASLQHHGDNLLNNIGYFGNTNFNLQSKSEYVYFNNATGGLTYYPADWSFPLALVTAILFLAYLVFLFRTGPLTFGRFAASIGLFIGMLIIGTTLTYFLWKGFEWLHPEYRWLLFGENYGRNSYLWGLSLLNFGLFCGIYGWIQTKLSTQQLLSGSFTFWILLSLAAAWYLPTASYISTWPALMALVGWIVLGNEITDSSWKTILILTISLSGVLFLIPPYIYLIQVMLTTKMIAVCMLLLLLVIGLSWAMVWQIIRNKTMIWSTALMLGAVSCFILASVNSGFDAHHKKQNDINYVQDLNSRQAYWVSRNFTTDSWTGQFLRSDFKQGTLRNIRFVGKRRVLFNSAPSLKIPSPDFEVLADSTSDSLRFVRLRIHPRQNGIGVQMGWDNASFQIAEIEIRDKPIYSKIHPVENQPKSINSISYFQDLSEPLEMNIVFSKTQNTILYFDFIRPGLPTQLLPSYQERTPEMMPAPYHVSNSTIWQAEINLDTLHTSE